jgi:predicted nuclease with TOPRIM domain
VNRVEVSLSGRMDKVEGRLERVEDRMDKLDGRMERVEMRMDRLGDRMEQLEGRFHGFHEALRDQTRQYILMLAGAMITLTAAVFGLARVA